MTGNRLAVISEWMVKGNINEFVKADINADRLGVVCFRSTSFPSLVTYSRVITVA